MLGIGESFLAEHRTFGLRLVEKPTNVIGNAFDDPAGISGRAGIGEASAAVGLNDVDQFMTVIADDFQDEEGNGKTKLRVALQAFKETGELAGASVNWSRMAITERDGLIDVRPVYIMAPDGEITIFLGFKSYRGGKLLIATGSAA